MVTVLFNRKGFSLLEMLIGIMMIASLSLVYLNYRKQINLDHYYFLNDYLLVQSEAIREKRDLSFEKGIRFNSMGHIDLARTIEFPKKRITLNLGNGYVLIK